MKRLFLVPALGVVGARAGRAGQRATRRLADLNRPSYADEARQPYNESRRVAYDNGYREGHQGRRTRRAAAATSSTIRTSGPGNAPTRVITAASATRNAISRRSAPDTRPATPTGTGALLQTTVTGATAGSTRILAEATAIRTRAATATQGKVVTAIPDRAATATPGRAATATARRSRMARTTATKRAARTPATATHTTRCGTSGIGRATTTTRARTVQGSSTRTSTGRASRKATTAATASGATGSSYQLSAVS